jgi:hypothetical protein
VIRCRISPASTLAYHTAAFEAIAWMGMVTAVQQQCLSAAPYLLCHLLMFVKMDTIFDKDLRAE